MQKCNQGIQNKYWTKLRFDQVSKDLTDLTWSKQSQHCGANNVDLTFFGEKFNIKKTVLVSQVIFTTVVGGKISKLKRKSKQISKLISRRFDLFEPQSFLSDVMSRSGMEAFLQCQCDSL